MPKSSYHWLSFAYPICEECSAKGHQSFVGVAIVRGRSLQEALARAMELGIHPAAGARGATGWMCKAGPS
jgi:hypothetical protein